MILEIAETKVKRKKLTDREKTITMKLKNVQVWELKFKQYFYTLKISWPC